MTTLDAVYVVYDRDTQLARLPVHSMSYLGRGKRQACVSIKQREEGSLFTI